MALVGLALNLATQAVRPAPLYLMDEVSTNVHKPSTVGDGGGGGVVLVVGVVSDGVGGIDGVTVAPAFAPTRVGCQG